MMLFRVLVLLGVALASCGAPSETRVRSEPAPVSKDFNKLLERGRAISTAKEHARVYSEIWMEILECAPSEEIRAEARYNLGSAGMRAKRSDVARKWFEQAVASEFVCAARGRSGYSLGMMQFGDGEYEAARTNLSIYLNSDPDNLSWIAAAELRRCDCLLKSGQTEEARVALKRFIASREIPDGHSAAAVKAARGLLAQLEERS